MAAPGEMTASLTLRLRDDLSAGIRELQEHFRGLKGTLDGLTNVLGDLRATLDSLKAPKAMMEGFQTSLRQATDISYAIGKIGIEGIDVGKELRTALTEPFLAVGRDVRAVTDEVKGIGAAAAASGKQITAVADAARATTVPVVAGARRRGARDGGDKGGEHIGGYWDWMMPLIGGAIGLDFVKNYASFMQPLGHAAITEKLSGPGALKEMKRLQVQLQGLALKTATSSMDLAGAEFFLITTGMREAMVQRMLPGLATASTAYNVPVTDMAQALFTLSENFRIPAGQMMTALAELAYATKLSHFGYAAFSQYLPMIGGQLYALGMRGPKAETTAAASLEIIRRNTGDSQSAATDLQNLMIYLHSPMGLRMFDMTKRMKDLLGPAGRGIFEKYHIKPLNLPAYLNAEEKKGIDPINAMVDYFRSILGPNVSKIERSDIIGALLHNHDAQNAMIALVEYSRDFAKFQKILGAVGPKTVATDFATAMQFPEVQVKLFQEEFAQLERAIGKDLLPVLGGVNVALKDLLSGLKGLDKIAPGLSTVLVQAVALALAFKTLAGVFRMGSGLIGKILGVGADAAEATVAGSWVAETAGTAAAAGAYGLLSPVVAVPAMTGAAIVAFKHVNEQAAKQAAKIWSDHAKATLNVTVETNESGLPVAHDANALPLLLHFSSPQVSGSLPGSSKLGLVLGRK